MGWNPIKWVYKKVIKPVFKVVGNLFNFNLTPKIPDLKLDPTDLGAPKVGGGYRIPQFLPPMFQEPGTTDKRFGGIVRVKGNLVFSATSGPDNKYLDLTYVLTSNYVSHVYVLNIDGKGLNYGYQTLSDFNIPNNSLIHTRKYASGYTAVKMFFNNGYTYPQRNPNTGYPTDLRFDHEDSKQYPGLAVIKVRYEAPDPNGSFDEPPFPSGIPDLTFSLVFGPETYHQQTPITLNSVTPAWQDVLTYNYPSTRNIAHQLYTYLHDPVHGAGVGHTITEYYYLRNPHGSIDVVSFINADQYLYGIRCAPHCGIIRLSEQPIVNNIQDILYLMQANLVFRDGKWVLKPDPNYVWFIYNCASTKNPLKYFSGSRPSILFKSIPSAILPTTHIINESDIIGSLSLESPKADQKYTDVEISYIDNVGEQRTVNIPEPQRMPFLANRKNTANKLSVSVNSTGEPYLLKEFLFCQSQYSDKIEMTLTPEFIGIEPGDLISVTFDAAQLSNRRYVVMTTELNADYSISVTAKKYLADVTFGVTLQRLLSATKSSTNIANRYFKNVLDIAASADYQYNTQVTRFLSSPVNLNPWTDYSVVKTGSPIWMQGIQKQELYLQMEGYNGNNVVNTISIKKQGESSFTRISSTLYRQTFGTSVSVKFKLNYYFETGQTYTFKLETRDLGTWQFMKTLEKSYTVPGTGLALLSSLSGGITTNDATANFLTGENNPFGRVIAGPTITANNVGDDSNLTWAEVDPTSGSMSAADQTLNRDQWQYYTTNDHIPWSHMSINSSLYGYTSSIQEAGYTHPSSIDLTKDTDFWWTASADVSPEPDDLYVKETWYENNLPGTFYSFGLGIVKEDTTTNNIAQISNTAFSPGSTTTPVAPIGRGRYVTPTTYVIAKGGGGEAVLGLQSYNVEIHTDTVTTTIKNIDTSALPAYSGGGTGQREVDLDTISPSTKFGRIQSISVVPSTGETQQVTGKIANTPTDNTNTFDIEVRNLSGTLVDATVDITIIGFPEVKAVLDTDGYPTAFVNNFTGVL